MVGWGCHVMSCVRGRCTACCYVAVSCHVLTCCFTELAQTPPPPMAAADTHTLRALRPCSSNCPSVPAGHWSWRQFNSIAEMQAHMRAYGSMVSSFDVHDDFYTLWNSQQDRVYRWGATGGSCTAAAAAAAPAGRGVALDMSGGQRQHAGGWSQPPAPAHRLPDLVHC